MTTSTTRPVLDHTVQAHGRFGGDPNITLSGEEDEDAPQKHPSVRQKVAKTNFPMSHKKHTSAATDFFAAAAMLMDRCPIGTGRGFGDEFV